MKLSLQQIKHQFNIKPPGWALRYHAFPRRDPRWRLMLRAYLSGLPKSLLSIQRDELLKHKADNGLDDHEVVIEGDNFVLAKSVRWQNGLNEVAEWSIDAELEDKNDDDHP